VARGQDEAVTPQPLRVAGVVAHQLLEEKVRGRRQAHGRSGVAVAHLLHRVRGQYADGIHRALVQVGPRQFLLFQMWHETGPLSVLTAGGTRGPFEGTPWGARCGVYQPFTIETLIFHSAT
jgi:hypothetical protein